MTPDELSADVWPIVNLALANDIDLYAALEWFAVPTMTPAADQAIRVWSAAMGLGDPHDEALAAYVAGRYPDTTDQLDGYYAGQAAKLLHALVAWVAYSTADGTR